MHQFRLFLTIIFSMTLVACGSSDEDDYKGPAALTGGQKLTASTAVTGLDKIERAADILDGDKEADSDIEELVAILRNCSVQGEGEMDENGNGWSRTIISGNQCPVTYSSETHWRNVDIGGDNYLDARTETNYFTESEAVLALVDLKSAATVAILPAGELPSFSAELDFVSIGRVLINDQITGRDLGNSRIEVTYFRRMQLDGFTVEARVIMKFRIDPGENDEVELVLEGLQLIINGQRVSAEEMYSIYPDAFGDFEEEAQLFFTAK